MPSRLISLPTNDHLQVMTVSGGLIPVSPSQTSLWRIYTFIGVCRLEAEIPRIGLVIHKHPQIERLVLSLTLHQSHFAAVGEIAVGIVAFNMNHHIYISPSMLRLSSTHPSAFNARDKLSRPKPSSSASAP